MSGRLSQTDSQSRLRAPSRAMLSRSLPAPPLSASLAVHKLHSRSTVDLFRAMLAGLSFRLGLPASVRSLRRLSAPCTQAKCASDMRAAVLATSLFLRPIGRAHV